MSHDPTQHKVRGRALCAAAEKLDLAAIELLLGGDGLPPPEIGCTDRQGEPPIALACDSEGPDELVLPVVRRLLDAGFHVDESNETMNGEELTGLMLALNRNRIDVVQLLMERGADPTLESRNRDNAFQWAISSEISTLQAFIGMLKQHFGEPGFVEFANRGTGVLHDAARFGSLDVMDLLVREGVDLEGLNDRGETPLMRVAMHCNDVSGAEGLMHLIRLGAKVTPDSWRARPGENIGDPKRFSPPEGMWALMLSVDPSQWPSFSPQDAGMAAKTPLGPLAAAMHLGDSDILLSMASQAKTAEEISAMQREAQLVYECSSGKVPDRRVADSFALLGARLSQQLIAQIARSRAPGPV